MTADEQEEVGAHIDMFDYATECLRDVAWTENKKLAAATAAVIGCAIRRGFDDLTETLLKLKEPRE